MTASQPVSGTVCGDVANAVYDAVYDAVFVAGRWEVLNVVRTVNGAVAGANIGGDMRARAVHGAVWESL